jgi:integrase
MSALINITRSRVGPKSETTKMPLGIEEKSVSQWSKYTDSVWILSIGVTIHWLRLPENQNDINSKAFNSLMAPVKPMAYLLIFEEELRPKSILAIVQRIKLFACWMLSQATPFTRFCDVPPSTINEYLEYLRRKPSRMLLTRRGRDVVTAHSVRAHIRALLRLYQYRDHIGDGLQDFRILLDATTVKEFERFQSTTEPIPDGEMQKLLLAAVNFVTENGNKTVHRLKTFIAKERVIEVHQALVKVGNDDLNRRRLAKAAERIKKALKPYTWERSSPLSAISLALKTNTSVGECAICLRQDRSLGNIYRQRRRERGDTFYWDLGDLNLKIRLLQIACFIIIAASTGMRLGELLAIQPGCLVKRKMRGVLLYWIKSTLSKTSPTRAGESAAWLCGDLAARAIGVLEQLHTALPSNTESKMRAEISVSDSLLRTFVWDGIILEARPVTCSKVLQGAMNLFVKETDLDVGYLHPHRFRRTFARNIVRWTETPLLALQRHFKHWSLLMTDYYVGIDPQLMEMFLEVQMEVSRVHLRQILSGECGGPGGLLLQKRLAKMADLGELPKGFRGRKREASIEALVDEMSRDGVLAFKCADFTTCLYVPATAKCGEDGPKEHECHPTECTNSYIELEDVPFYLKNIAQNIRVYERLNSTEQCGPYGLFVLKRIRNDRAAIKPLAQLYQEELRRLQEHYESLSEAEAQAAPGLELRNRIDEEVRILKGVITDG